MKSNSRVTIGIAAFNEENNIKYVLKDILKQKEREWKLKKILLIDDGSTDNTVKEASDVVDRRVSIIHNNLRRGKTKCLQMMFEKLSTEVLVMLDADIKIGDKNTISSLIKPLFLKKNTMLVGGNSKPFTPKTFFEKAVYTTFEVFYKSRLKLRGGNNIFGCTGSILAIKQAFAKTIKFPSIVNEDAYLYMKCVTKGFLFRYVDSAKVYYKLPNNIRDYVRQIFRSEPQSVTKELQKYFHKKVDFEFHRPVSFYLSAVLEVFVKNPVGVSFVVVINLLCKPFLPFVLNKYRIDWFTAHSTKIINNN